MINKMLHTKLPTVKQPDKLYMYDKIMICNKTTKSKIPALLNSGRFKWKWVGNYGSRELDDLISSMVMRARPFSKRCNYSITYSSIVHASNSHIHLSVHILLLCLIVHDIDSEVVRILTWVCFLGLSIWLWFLEQQQVSSFTGINLLNYVKMVPSITIQA